MTSVLALDVGSSSVRCIAYDETAAVISPDMAKRRHDLQAGGFLDPQRLLDDTRAVLSEAAAGLDAPADAIGFSCIWHSLLALDESGRPLTPLLSWRDVRSAAQALELARRVDADAVRERTGCPLHASFWPAKLAWLAADQPDTFRAARRFVGFADWLFLQETAELRTSTSMASGTGLWSEDAWDEELLDALGLDAERLPLVSDEPVGPWYPALGDGACSNLGSGCVTPERAALNVGTSSAIRVVTDEPAPEGLFRYRVDAERAIVGGALSVGGNLEDWLRATLRDTGGEGLADREPADHGLTFVPHLAGERSPGWDSEATGAIAGMRFETTADDLLQAGLEAVALELRRVADLLPGVEEIVVSGGTLADNPDWLQIVADVLERPLSVSAEHEASARGAAVHVLERLGHPPPQPEIARVVQPRAERAAAYREALQRHLRLGAAAADVR